MNRLGNRYLWRRALLISLVSHGLLLLGLFCLSPRLAPPMRGVTEETEFPSSPTDEEEPICFLVSQPPHVQFHAAPQLQEIAPLPAHTNRLTPPALPPPTASQTPTAPTVPSHGKTSPPAASVPQPPPLPELSAPAETSKGPQDAASPRKDNSNQPSNLPGTKASTTTFFSVPAQGDRIVYILDRSASMGLAGRLTAAQRELARSLHQLPPTAHFQVIIYNSTARLLLPDQPGLLLATPANIQRALEALAHLSAEGGTRPEQALPLALALRPAVIYFLTDAGNLSEDTLRFLVQHNYAHSVIHAIELTSREDPLPSPSWFGQQNRPLERLAQWTGGTYRAVVLVP